MREAIPSVSENSDEERICKTAAAIFYHFGKNKLTRADSLVCVAGIVATIIQQTPTEDRDRLIKWFNAMIDPLAPKIVRPDGNPAN